MTESIAADSGFATLEIDADELRDRLVKARVTTPEVAQGVVEMDNQQLQEAFGLRCRRL